MKYKIRYMNYPYPVETLKHWYVTIVGGQSQDLKPCEVGVNRNALAENTDIVPYEDAVLISKLEGSSTPLFRKRYFTVIPLNKDSPDACKSPGGEVVLPVLDRRKSRYSPLVVGEPVILNNVLSRRHNPGFARIMDRHIKRRTGASAIEYL